MTIKESMLAVYRKENKGKIPFAAYEFLFPRGKVERQLRHGGCGVISWCPVSSLLSPAPVLATGDFWVYESEVKDVEMSIKAIQEDNQRVFVRTYKTPLGSVFDKIREDPSYHSPWVKKFLINDPGDYEIVKFIVENTVYHENYDAFVQAQETMGDDGVILGLVDRSPWQQLLIELAGTERLSMDLYDNRSLVEDLLSSIEKKLDEAYRMAANSPAEVIWAPENITGDITSPKIFQKYVLPFWNKQAKTLHRNNKIFAVHLDGKLRCLSDLIRKSNIDVVESFTLPEGGGDVPIEKASIAWVNKSLVANLPASLCFKEEEVIREYVRKLLSDVSPRKDFMLEISENLPHPHWQKCLPVVGDVMQAQ